jgi:hypothetical protein
MKRLYGFAFLLLLAVAYGGALAHDSRCDGAPYTVSPEKYPALIKLLTNLFGAPKTETISKICDMKFNGADRTALYKLGFTDEQIDTADTETLVVNMITALKKVLDALPPQ